MCLTADLKAPQDTLLRLKSLHWKVTAPSRLKKANIFTLFAAKMLLPQMPLPMAGKAMERLAAHVTNEIYGADRIGGHNGK